MQIEAYLAYRKRVAAYDPAAFARAQAVDAPADATDFALRVAYVILNGGMRWSIAIRIWPRMVNELQTTGKVGDSFGHKGKASAIETVMADRHHWFALFQRAREEGPEAVIDFCPSLPFIGDTTKFHLAKNLGVDCAKPDIWLERVAAASGETTHALCVRLSALSGDRVRLVDYVIWRTCQQGWWA